MYLKLRLKYGGKYVSLKTELRMQFNCMGTVFYRRHNLSLFWIIATSRSMVHSSKPVTGKPKPTSRFLSSGRKRAGSLDFH